MGPSILSSTGAGVLRKALVPLPDSRSVLDEVQSAKKEEKGCDRKKNINIRNFGELAKLHLLSLGPLKFNSRAGNGCAN